MDVEVVVAKGDIVDVERLVTYFRNSSGDGVALDHRSIAGMDHLDSALMHARRAMERGENSSPRLLMETMLYAAGERQLSVAIARIGVKPGSEGCILLLQGLDPDHVLADLRLQRGEGLPRSTDEKATKEALEKVALVDIIKR